MRKNRIIAGVVFLMIASSMAVWAGGQNEELRIPESATELRAVGEKAFEGSAVVLDDGTGPVNLTEEKAVEYALENNLGLKSEAINVRIKERTADYAWNRFIPTVQASGTMARMNAEQSTFDFSGGLPTMVDLPQWSVSAGLDMWLTLSLAIGRGIRATQIDYQGGLISYEQAQRKLERDVRKSFYNLLLMRENRKLMVENIDAAERRYDQARINYENGM